jgi:hypothetical protein
MFNQLSWNLHLLTFFHQVNGGSILIKIDSAAFAHANVLLELLLSFFGKRAIHVSAKKSLTFLQFGASPSIVFKISSGFISLPCRAFLILEVRIKHVA